MPYIYYNNELYHHGVNGQKWGVRRAEWYPIDEWKKSLSGTGSILKKKDKKKNASDNNKEIIPDNNKEMIPNNNIDNVSSIINDYYHNKRVFYKSIKSNKYNIDDIKNAMIVINTLNNVRQAQLSELRQYFETGRVVIESLNKIVENTNGIINGYKNFKKILTSII